MRAARPVQLALVAALVVILATSMGWASTVRGEPVVPGTALSAVHDAGAPLVAAAPRPATISGTPVSVAVGGAPAAVAIDAPNDTAFVACQFDQTVYALNLSTETVVATYPVGAFPAPQGVVYSPQNSTIFVANEGSNNVSAISLPLATTFAIQVGTSPEAITYDSANKLVYVANFGSASVSLISPVTDLVVATVPVQSDPDAIAIDTTNHDIFVADAGTQNVSVISGISNTVIGTAFAGVQAGADGAIGYDPADKDVYVANEGSDNVTVIGGANHTAFLSIAVGSNPTAVAVDSALGEVFVANEFSDNVSVISTKSQTVVATIAVGDDPATDGAMTFNPATGDLYVPNWGSDNVSIISAATNSVAKTVAVGAAPNAIAYDPVGGAIYVTSQGDANVTIFQTAPVTFAEKGLPNGAVWSVSTGAPPLTFADKVAKGKGSVTALEFTGPFSYKIAAPAGFGIASVAGKGNPSQTSGNVSSVPLTLTVHFGALENLTFTETGLASGSVWGVAIAPPPSPGAPAPQAKTTSLTSISFTVVQGPWKFHVTPVPGAYRASPSHGSVTVPAHSFAEAIKFTLPVAKVTFREFDLVPGTVWRVNVTGPVNLSVTSKKPTLSMSLENGTYSFNVSNFSKLHPHPASGTISVVAPGPSIVVTITYTAATSNGSGAPQPVPTPVASGLPATSGGFATAPEFRPADG